MLEVVSVRKFESEKGTFFYVDVVTSEVLLKGVPVRLREDGSLEADNIWSSRVKSDGEEVRFPVAILFDDVRAAVVSAVQARIGRESGK